MVVFKAFFCVHPENLGFFDQLFGWWQLKWDLNGTHFGGDQTMQMLLLMLRDVPYYSVLFGVGYITRWWQLKYVLEFSPRKLGEDFSPILTIIFFNRGGD